MWFLGYIVLNLFLFSPDFFLIFHNTITIYNTRNRNNDTTESQKAKKTCFNAHAGGKWNFTVQCIVNKQIWEGLYPCNNMWSLKSLVMLKCESRTNLHVVQYKWQQGSILMFCLYYFRNGKPRHFVLMFCGTASLALLLACS